MMDIPMEFHTDFATDARSLRSYMRWVKPGAEPMMTEYDLPVSYGALVLIPDEAAVDYVTKFMTYWADVMVEDGYTRRPKPPKSLTDEPILMGLPK